MTVYSGLFGRVSGDVQAGNWNLSKNSSVSPLVTSATGTATHHRPGITSWQGQWKSLKTLPVVLPGDFTTLELIAGFPNDDTADINGAGFEGDAIIDSA